MRRGEGLEKRVGEVGFSSARTQTSTLHLREMALEELVKGMVAGMVVQPRFQPAGRRWLGMRMKWRGDVRTQLTARAQPTLPVRQESELLAPWDITCTMESGVELD